MWKVQLLAVCIWTIIITTISGLVWHEIKQEQYNRALLAAVARRDTEVTAFLLKRGADPNAEEQPGRSLSPLRWALSWLNRNAPHPIPARSALLVAVEGSYFPTFPVRTPPDNPKLVVSLLHAGANVNARDEAGNPALLYAALSGNRTMVTLLLGYDADVSMRLSHGSTLLMTLMGGGVADRRILSEVADRSAIDARDDAGRTALTAAVQSGNLEGVRLLLARHADVDTWDNRGESACTLARRAFRDDPAPNRRQIVELLKSQSRLTGEAAVPARRS